MTYYYKFTEIRDHPIWYLLFHFGTLSFFLSIVYHLIVFVSLGLPQWNAG